MARRLVQLVALVIAVALAAGAGTLLRQHLAGPDPIDAVKAATHAYATGDCAALREVADEPQSVNCTGVKNVRDAYRAEGLDPKEFTYEIIAEDDDEASVRISYRRDKHSAEEIVQLTMEDGDWKVRPAPVTLG